jgi:gentisate 1,2-dioxygenase
VNPVTGGHLLPTLGARIQMLTQGMRTQPHRHTSYTIYHVVQGEGVTVVGDKRFEWSKGDCFTVPNWQWHTHEQHGGEPAILFSAHDQPILEAFDLYREEIEEG